MVLVFAFTLFLSSSLLFVVQPMIAKMVLPLLGGTPAVWNTCMVFFQAMLLAGYLYAHASTRWLGSSTRRFCTSCCSLSFLVLPCRRGQQTEPPATGKPIGWLLRVLLITVGLPFVLVSSSGPLLQRWFARTEHPRARDPYFLYVASNLGSIIALLAYPALVEPSLRLAEQSSIWTGGYVGLVVLTASVSTSRTASRPPIARSPATPAANPTAGRARHRARLASSGFAGWRSRSCRRASCSGSRRFSRPTWPRCRFSGSCRSSCTC